MKCEACNGDNDGSHGSGRFCCIACSNSRKHKKDTNKSCIHCGSDVLVVVTYPTKYVMCDKCQPKNRRKPRKVNRSKCLLCGTPVKYLTSVYCSTDCSTIAKRNELYKFVKDTNGLGDANYTPKTRALKGFLLCQKGNMIFI